MSHLFRIEDDTAHPMVKSSMAAHGLKEVQHLEQWVLTHEEILGDGVKIVTKEFDKWGAGSGELAGERLDVLGLDASGQLVVVELKLAKDKKIHLQAITYAALVANFTKDLLAEAHASYRSSVEGREVTVADARARLEGHVDGDWDDDILGLPRITLVAEAFPPQVLTTARWLERASGGSLQIECIVLDVFHQASDDGPGLVCASFRRVWPVDDLEDRILAPLMAQAKVTQQKIAAKAKMANAVSIVSEGELIPLGSSMSLHLATWVDKNVVATVEDWLHSDPSRASFTWSNYSNKPLAWGVMPQETYSLTGLAKQVIHAATGVMQPTIPGGNVWFYGTESVYDIASTAAPSEAMKDNDS